MSRHVNFFFFFVLVWLIHNGVVEAEIKNCALFPENPNYRNILKSIVPEEMLANLNETSAIDETCKIFPCLRDLIILSEAITHNESWALTMLDASSKLPSGLRQGNYIDLGQYDECIAVRSHSSKHEIRGRHCMYSIAGTQEYLKIPINLRLSLCVPATCSSDDVISLFNATTLWIDKLKNLKIKIPSAKCSPVDPIVWDFEFTACLIILACYVTFLVACTIMELIDKNLPADDYRHPIVQALSALSLRKSAASILNTDEKDGILPAIHGIRVLSMAWIVLGHEYALWQTSATVNTFDIDKWVLSWNSLYILLADFAVDSLLTMSGFLITYLFLKQMRRRNRINILMYYLHRYLRLTPALIALLVFVIVFVPKLGSGAQWDVTMDFYLGGCRTNWFYYLLHVQNIVEQDKVCLGHLGNLAVDMQLFLISPLILYPLYKKPKLGLILLAALFIASLVVPAMVIGIEELPVVSFTDPSDSAIAMEIIDEFHEVPSNRAGAWLIGIFVGYEVAMNDRQLSRRSIVAGWLTAILSFAFCVSDMRSFIDPHYEHDAFWKTFFGAVCGPIWAIGVSWIIYACIKNRTGSLSRILSSRIFLPLSRISYCVYLVHINFQIMHVGSQRTSTYFSAYYLWRSFLCTLVISVAFGFLFSLLFESPVLVLEKMLLKKIENLHLSRKSKKKNYKND